MMAQIAMNKTLAEYIAMFNGRKVKFRERKFHKHLRKELRKAVKRNRDNNKQPAID